VVFSYALEKRQRVIRCVYVGRRELIYEVFHALLQQQGKDG
jgi:hypothetical protein